MESAFCIRLLKWVFPFIKLALSSFHCPPLFVSELVTLAAMEVLSFFFEEIEHLIGFPYPVVKWLTLKAKRYF